MTNWIQGAAMCAALALLSGCGGSGQDGAWAFGANPAIGEVRAIAPDVVGGSESAAPVPVAQALQVDDLPAGNFRVSTGNPDHPTMGRYYASADGMRLLALEGDDESMDLFLRRANAAAAWTAVPTPDPADVRLLRSEAQATRVRASATLAGHYVTRLPDGSAADFNLNADGRIVSGTVSACRISGALTPGSFPSTLTLKLESRDCAGLPAIAAGLLTVDLSDAPAALRLLADDGNTIVDLRGYSESGS